MHYQLPRRPLQNSKDETKEREQKRGHTFLVIIVHSGDFSNKLPRKIHKTYQELNSCDFSSKKVKIAL